MQRITAYSTCKNNV
ncbi:hypothetical protein V3C99_008782, partial [Haemonchus contortus]